jgi:hypothetical protein
VLRLALVAFAQERSISLTESMGGPNLAAAVDARAKMVDIDLLRGRTKPPPLAVLDPDLQHDMPRAAPTKSRFAKLGADAWAKIVVAGGFSPTFVARTLSTVCRDWYMLSSKDQIWKLFYDATFGEGAGWFVWSYLLSCLSISRSICSFGFLCICFLSAYLSFCWCRLTVLLSLFFCRCMVLLSFFHCFCLSINFVCCTPSSIISACR